MKNAVCSSSVALLSTTCESFIGLERSLTMLGWRATSEETLST